MEENEVMLLKNSKMYVTRVGRWMNVFSILSVIVMLLLAAGGIVMLFVSNMLDESTPYYVDNILGLAGVGVIIGAGAIIPAVVYMRRAVRMAKQVKVSQELYPIVNFLRENRKLWHYLSVVLILVVIAAAIGLLLSAIYLLPMVQGM